MEQGAGGNGAPLNGLFHRNPRAAASFPFKAQGMKDPESTTKSLIIFWLFFFFLTHNRLPDNQRFGEKSAKRLRRTDIKTALKFGSRLPQESEIPNSNKTLL